MKPLLIAIYLASGSASPEYRTASYETLKECREVAKQYTQRAVKGQAWAFCTQPKGEPA